MSEIRLKSVMRDAKHRFTYEEVKKMEADVVANINQQAVKARILSGLQDEMKAVKTAIANYGNLNTVLAKKIEDGEEVRQMECYKVKDFDRREFVFFRVDTLEKIGVEAFSYLDSQTTIEGEPTIENWMDFLPENDTRVDYEDDLPFDTVDESTGLVVKGGPLGPLDHWPGESDEVAEWWAKDLYCLESDPYDWQDKAQLKKLSAVANSTRTAEILDATSTDHLKVVHKSIHDRWQEAEDDCPLLKFWGSAQIDVYTVIDNRGGWKGIPDAEPGDQEEE